VEFLELFTKRPINSIEDYERFYHVKCYLRSRSKKYKTTRELMRASGYGNIDKFRRHREAFDNLQRRVPLAYLRAIGVDFEVIKWCLKLDYRDFKRACKIPLYPKYAIARALAAVYISIPIPDNTPEDEAIEIVRSFAMEKGMNCCINYPGLKTIFIKPQGTVHTLFYPPELRFTKHWLVVEDGGESIGTVKI